MSKPYRCPRCVQKYGEVGRPANFESDPQCAFPDGVFTTDNWMCSTMSDLRRIAETNRTWFEDSTVGVVPFESDDYGCAFIVLKWYKSRGATEMAVLFNRDDDPVRITLGIADAALRYHRIADSSLRRVK